MLYHLLGPRPPKVLYHGTEKTFDRFELTRDIGFHFGPEAIARRRVTDGLDEYGCAVDAWIIQVALDIAHPLILPDLNHWTPRDIAEQLTYRGLLTEQEKARVEDIGRGAAPDEDDRGPFDVLREALWRHGYDGIVYMNDIEMAYVETDAAGEKHRRAAETAQEGLCWIALHPDQVRCLDRRSVHHCPFEFDHPWSRVFADVADEIDALEFDHPPPDWHFPAFAFLNA